MSEMYAGLKYGAILADPPWRFEVWSAKGEDRSATNHYSTRQLDELAKLPVSSMAADDCALFLWASDPLLLQALSLMAAWGFTYKTVAFTWAKTTGSSTMWVPTWHMGLGYWTRANPEMCLLGTRGSPKRRAKDVRQLVVSPKREHSRKPDEIRDHIARLVDGPYLEMFARSSALYWDSWGHETDKFDENTLFTTSMDGV